MKNTWLENEELKKVKEQNKKLTSLINSMLEDFNELVQENIDLKFKNQKLETAAVWRFRINELRL